MTVSVWKGGSAGIHGIRVGRANRDRYFDRSWAEVEVEIDGTVHRFGLMPAFWNKCPEFRDRGEPIIRIWLTAQGLISWPKVSPPQLTLEPLGRNRFRLSL